MSLSDRSCGTMDHSIPRETPGMLPGALKMGLCSRARGVEHGEVGEPRGAAGRRCCCGSPGSRSPAQPILRAPEAPRAGKHWDKAVTPCQGCCGVAPVTRAGAAPSRHGQGGSSSLPSGAAWQRFLRDYNSQRCHIPAQGES